MNEDFVTYELAVILKEKGFDIPFYFYYRTDDESLHHANVTNPLVYCDKIDDEVVIAPTISQVLEWLRDEKKIVISIFPHPCGWQADIYKDVHQYYDSEAECYLMYYYKEKTEISHSYNWLEIYCIQYVLDNLILL